MQVRHHRLEDSVAALQAVERALSPHVSPAERLEPFRLMGSWLIRESVLVPEAVSAFGVANARAARPGLDRFTIAKLLRARLVGKRIEIASNAYAIALKSNVRGFYAAPAFQTLKVPSPGLGADSLVQEIAVRRALEGVRSVRVPEMIDCSEEPASPYILEKSVTGARLDKKTMRAFMKSVGMPGILDFYEERVPSLSPVGSVLDFSKLRDDIRDAAGEFSTGFSEGERSSILGKIDRLEQLENHLVVMVHGHGDLSVNNVIVTASDEMCLIDWERAARMLLFEDLEKLLEQFRELRPMVEQRAAGWFRPSQAGRLLGSDDQLQLALLCRFGRSIEGWRRCRMQDGEVARIRTDFHLRSARQRLSSLSSRS